MILSDRRVSIPLAAIAALAGALLATGRPGPANAEPTSPATGTPRVARDTVPSFAADVLPIFRSRCGECHGGESSDGQVYTEAFLDLQSYEAVMAGSEYGPVVEPGDPDASVLIQMITDGDMPEEGDPVPPEEIALIAAWIEAGAPDN